MFTLYRFTSSTQPGMYLGYTTDVEKMLNYITDPTTERKAQHVLYMEKHGGLEAWDFEELKKFKTLEEVEAEKWFLQNLHRDLYTINKNGFIEKIPGRRRRKAKKEDDETPKEPKPKRVTIDLNI